MIGREGGGVAGRTGRLDERGRLMAPLPRTVLGTRDLMVLLHIDQGSLDGQEVAMGVLVVAALARNQRHLMRRVDMGCLGLIGIMKTAVGV